MVKLRKIQQYEIGRSIELRLWFFELFIELYVMTYEHMENLEIKK